MDNTQYPKMLSLDHGPSIHVCFYIQKSNLERIELSLSQRKGLSWSFAGRSFPALESALGKWLYTYIMGKFLLTPFTLDLEYLPPYTSHVLAALQTIPFGEHRSYKDIAVLTGKPKAARAVGNACSQNPFPLIIPCHRVITHQGHLGGFTGGLEVKKRLLDFERIAYKEACS